VPAFQPGLHAVVLRNEGLDALNGDFQRVRELPHIRGFFGPKLFFQLIPRKLINRGAQVFRVVLDGIDDAGENECKLNLRGRGWCGILLWPQYLRAHGLFSVRKTSG